ncbi:hypothetical protein TEA_029279 [Camellia sinensis var. sinensis]|uniref:Uncharacterized protein n=1 Tax=Camellia sinensis var. sinensis TaxID=542762 RepID=A0A4S4ESW0_CAMSN|nr:hypothetical protein TEA_029279 [Camellia sinensis var. sinensis]
MRQWIYGSKGLEGLWQGAEGEVKPDGIGVPKGNEEVGEPEEGRVELHSYSDESSLEWETESKRSQTSFGSAANTKHGKVERKKGTPWTEEEHSHLMDPLTTDLRNMNVLAKVMRQRRIDRGALTLASAEVKFQIDTETHDSLDIDVATTMILTLGPVIDFLLANQNALEPRNINWAKSKKKVANPSSASLDIYLNHQMGNQTQNELSNRSDACSPPQIRPPNTPTWCSSVDNIVKNTIFLLLSMTKVYDHRIYQYLVSPLEPLSIIKDDEHIVAYRLPKSQAELTRLEIYHCDLENLLTSYVIRVALSSKIISTL